jgi:hypothetical protein
VLLHGCCRRLHRFCVAISSPNFPNLKAGRSNLDPTGPGSALRCDSIYARSPVLGDGNRR